LELEALELPSAAGRGEAVSVYAVFHDVLWSKMINRAGIKSAPNRGVAFRRLGKSHM
jgi:hypothetical protein